MNRIKDIETHGITAQGRRELLRYLNGKALTYKQAVKAKCYDCEGYYQDGRVKCEIKTCPLWPFNNYAENANYPSTVRKKRGLGEVEVKTNGDGRVEAETR